MKLLLRAEKFGGCDHRVRPVLRPCLLLLLVVLASCDDGGPILAPEDGQQQVADISDTLADTPEDAGEDVDVVPVADAVADGLSETSQDSELLDADTPVTPDDGDTLHGEDGADIDETDVPTDVVLGQDVDATAITDATDEGSDVLAPDTATTDIEQGATDDATVDTDAGAASTDALPSLDDTLPDSAVDGDNETDAAKSDAAGDDASADDPDADALSASDDAAGEDAGASNDAGSDGDATTDVEPACQTALDCATETPYCVGGTCVACGLDAHCAQPGAMCVSGSCQLPVPCQSDKACIAVDGVCDPATEVCVGCLSDVDCAADTVCDHAQCLLPPTPCKSSKDCTGDKICSLGFCLECKGDADCLDSQWCDAGVCVPDACEAGVATCGNAAEVLTCAANGSGWTASACGAGSICEGEGCVPLVCDPDSLICSGNEVLACNPTGTAMSSTSCGDAVCKGGACYEKVCAAGSTTCQDGKVQSCSNDGTSWTTTACAEGSSCADGQCEVWTCAPQSVTCEGAKVMQCDASGLNKDVVVDCAQSGQICLSGKCTTSQCVAGSHECDGEAQLLTCKEDGSGWEGSPCGQNNICVVDVCLAVVCTKGTYTCAGNLRQQCNATGTQVDTIADCAASDAACIEGSCVPLICTPGSKDCSGADLATCNTAGTAYAISACASGSTCAQGACSPVVCAASTARCSANEVWTCNGTGTSEQLTATCPSSTTACVSGACVAKICTPGATSCNGTDLQICNTSGTAWQAANCDAGKVCAGSGCVAVICNPGATQCAGNVVQTCNASGTAWQSGTDCAAASQTCAGGVCVAQTCVPGSKSCGSGEIITCNAAGSGYSSQNCSDGNPCTTDTCSPQTLSCTYALFNCDDGNACTADSCLGGTCSHAASTGACDDGNLCTTGEICANSACAPAAGTLSTAGGAASSGMVDGIASSVRMTSPAAIIGLRNGNFAFADGGRLRYLTPEGGAISWSKALTGGANDGGVEALRYQTISALAEAPDGSIWFAESSDDQIKRFANGKVRIIAGSSGTADGVGTAAGFSFIAALAFGSDGWLYVADQTGNRLRRVSAGGVVTTVAGTGIAGSQDGPALSATLQGPCALAAVPDGTLYFYECGSYKMRKLTPQGQVTTVSGDGIAGYLDGSAASCRWGKSLDLAVAQDGLVVYDTANYRIRKMAWDGSASTLAGTGSSGYATGPALSTSVGSGAGVAVDRFGDVLFAAKPWYRIGKLTRGQRHCDDGNPCTTDACTSTGCTFSNVDTALACSDGNACTSGDVCTTGSCKGVVKVCDDGLPCTEDVCNFADASCETMAVVGACSDGDRCVSDGICEGTACVHKGAQLLTAAGNVSTGIQEGWGNAGRFNYLYGVVGTPDGGALMTDVDNYRLRSISPSGVVTTVVGGSAGSIDGPLGVGRMYAPTRITRLPSGTYAITDPTVHRVRGWDGTQLTTIAGTGSSGFLDGPVASAKFSSPWGIAAGSDGTLYVADPGNYRIRAIKDGQVTTFAGVGTKGNTNGTVSGAQFTDPRGICVDPLNGDVFVVDTLAHVVRKISGGLVTTLAGVAGASWFRDEVGTKAYFRRPTDCVVDDSHNVYVADSWNYRIRKIKPDGTVTTIAGSTAPASGNSTVDLGVQTPVDGGALTGVLSRAWGIALAGPGQLWVADNGLLRRLHLPSPDCSDSVPCTHDTCEPTTGVCSHGAIADGGACQGPDMCILSQTCLSGNCIGGAAKSCDDGQPCTADSCDSKTGICSHTDVDIACTDGDACTQFEWCFAGSCKTDLWNVATVAGNSTQASVDGTGTAAGFGLVRGLAQDADGSFLVSDGGCNCIRRVSEAGVVTTVAGGTSGFADGSGATAKLYVPHGIEREAAGTFVIADYGNSRIRRLTGNTVTTVAGTGDAGYADGPTNTAKFYSPADVAVGPDDTIYVADLGGGRVRAISPQGMVSTVAGTGATAGGSDGPVALAVIPKPTGVCVGKGGELYISDAGTDTIRLVKDGVVTTLAGKRGFAGVADGKGSEARFDDPAGCDMGADGNLYVVDDNTGRVRRVTPSGEVTTVLGWNSPRVGGTIVSDGLSHAAKLREPQALQFGADGSLWIADHIVIRRAASSAVDCDDADPCTADSCDPNTKACSHVALADGAACADGNPCTLGEKCTAGTCAGGILNACEDGDSCTTNSCDPVVGCVATPVVSASCCTLFGKSFGFESGETGWSTSPKGSFLFTSTTGSSGWAVNPDDSTVGVYTLTLDPMTLPATAPVVVRFRAYLGPDSNRFWDPAQGSFRVLVNGQELWSAPYGTTFSLWETHEVDLGAFLGQQVSIALQHEVKEANSTYVWFDDLTVVGRCQ